MQKVIDVNKGNKSGQGTGSITKAIQASGNPSVSGTDPNSENMPMEEEINHTNNEMFDRVLGLDHGLNSKEGNASLPSVDDSVLGTDPRPNIAHQMPKLCDLKIKLTRIELDEKGAVEMTKELQEKIATPSKDNYESDKTVLYFPIKENLPRKPKVILVNRGKTLTKPAKHLIRAHPSRARFKISIYGVKHRKNRTYIGCKIPG